MFLVERPSDGSLGKPSDVQRRPLGLCSGRVALAVLLAPTAWLLGGCGTGGDLISTVALPSEQSTGYGKAEGFEVGASPDSDRLVVKPELTPVQRGYLDALEAAGVHPSNELRALSIGSYVCQARAAGQSDTTVWDSVAPMVRSDIAAARSAAPQGATAIDMDAAIGSYIGIAKQRLC